MKNLIGLLLFGVSAKLMAWAMAWITDKRAQSEIIKIMRAWTDTIFDCPSPHPLVKASREGKFS
jgi:hypothetical protein